MGVCGEGPAGETDPLDPETGPRIDPDHPTMDDPERSWVLRYLESGELLLVTSATMEDVIDPQPVNPVPMSCRTDGFWIWNDAIAYYLERHGVAPDRGLVGHIRERGYAFVAVDGVGLHRAHAAMVRLMTGDSVSGG